MTKLNTRANNVLVLQGGGALGAYQAGGYSRLSAEGIEPDYVAGISIGAINAALIAGNEPERRVERLRTFWERVTGGDPFGAFVADLMGGFLPRSFLNAVSATNALMRGAPGFFSLRMPPPFMAFAGSPAATSFYDTAALRETLLELIDFDLLNSGRVRLAVGAVNVLSGNLVYFDSSKLEIRPEHIMASGALPPGFPAVEIDGEYYWDGGIVSNTPLQYVLDNHDRYADMQIFQFDLFNARGEVPQDLWSVESREKEIRYSSRTRYTTDRVADLIRVRAAMHRLYDQLPDVLRESKDVRLLMEASHPGKFTIVHLIHRSARHQLASKDYEFSRLTMEELWRDGGRDVDAALSHRDFVNRDRSADDLIVVDATSAKQPR